jgi:hypothetical protein
MSNGRIWQAGMSADDATVRMFLEIRSRDAKLRAEENAAAVEDAAHRKRHQALGEYLDEREAEHGAFTEEELAETAEKLGWPWPPERKAAQ